VDLADVPQRPAVCIPDQGNVGQAPDDAPVLVEVALLHLEVAGRAGQQRFPAGVTLGQVVRVGDVGHRHPQQLLGE